jgi:predicted neuraminidase
MSTMPKDSTVIVASPGPEYADDTRLWQGIPGIERASNGRLWALWYSGGKTEGPGNYVVLVTSADDGQTWSGPKLVIDPGAPRRAFDPVLWHDPQGRLWLFWAQSVEWFDGRAGVWAITTSDSDSESPTWSEPRRICDGIMMNKPTVLSSGEWLLPAAVWKRALNLGVPGMPPDAYACCSVDSGASWEVLGAADVPGSTFDEHMIVDRGDGSLWMLVRTEYGIGESISIDRGRTWSPGQESSIPHVDTRFFIRRLASGRLIMVRHNPPDMKSRSHLTAYLSDDDGRSWYGGFVIDEREGVSYPDGLQSPDGSIYIIYDFERYGAKQILMAKLSEDDIVQGAPVSYKNRLRVLVNQAGV